MKRSDPLGPWLYLLRRPGRALPTGMVISCVTALLILVITPGNSFYETSRANLRSLEVFTVVAPSLRAGFDDSLQSLLDRNPFMDHSIRVKALWMRYPMLIGEGSCPLVLSGPREARALLDRLGLELVAGRYPDGSEPVVVIQEDVARARGLTLGSRVGALVDPEDIIPGQFEVVGLLRGSTRIAAGVIGAGPLTPMLSARVPLYMLIYAMPGKKQDSDNYLRSLRDGERSAFQVIDTAYVRERMDRALKNLPLMVDFIAVSSSLIVAFVVVLLTLISFQSRLPDLAVLLAIGQSRRRLQVMLIGELAILALLAWLLGTVLGLLGVTVYDSWALKPRGILIRVLDTRAILAGACLPILVIAAGAIALWRSLGRMDPVSVVQRRGP